MVPACSFALFEFAVRGMSELILLKKDALRGVLVALGWLMSCVENAFVDDFEVVAAVAMGRSGAVRRRVNGLVVNLLRVSERDNFR